MKVINILLFLLLPCALLYAGHIKISLRPFRVSVEYPALIFGLTLLLATFVLIAYHYSSLGYRQGYIESTNDTIKYLDDYIEAQKKKDEAGSDK